MGRLPVCDFSAGHEHFVRHLAPVWLAMPPEMRGGFFTTKKLDPGFRDIPSSPRAGRGDLTIAASYGDLYSSTATDWVSRRPAVYLEHGAGFTFADEWGRTYSSYSGSADRPNVALFLNPNDYVSRANEATHPYIPNVVIGDPTLDRWFPDTPRTPYQRGEAELPTVAIALHWDCILAPGTRSAYDHYRGHFGDLLGRNFNIIGTAHPRMKVAMQFEYLSAGITYVDDIDEVYAQADLLIADATSSMYEFAALGRPVVVLNAPWYRQEADDGLRFWQHIPGIQVNDPLSLADTVEYALTDPPEFHRQRQDAVDVVYPFRGDSAARAVRAIKEFAEDVLS